MLIIVGSPSILPIDFNEGVAVAVVSRVEFDVGQYVALVRRYPRSGTGKDGSRS